VTTAGDTTTASDAKVNAPEVYSTVNEPATASDPNPENVATPEAGVAVAVSTGFPPESLTVAVTSVDQVATAFPPESTAVITGCGAKSEP
jgi:hypothetical protein